MPMTTPTEEDLRYMRRAIELARIAAETPGALPIGCVIVRDGQILGEGTMRLIIRHDPTAHAEIVTMQRVGRVLGSADFGGATLYSTLSRAACAAWRRSGARSAGSYTGPGAKTCTACILRTATSTRSTFRRRFPRLSRLDRRRSRRRMRRTLLRPDDNPPLEDQGNI